MQNRKLRALILLGYSLLNLPLSAQEVPATPEVGEPTIVLDPPSHDLGDASIRDVSRDAPRIVTHDPAEPASSPVREELPRWKLHLGLDSSVTYDDNIFIQPRARQADFYFGLTPIFTAGWGAVTAEPSILTGPSNRFPTVAENGSASNSLLLRYAPTAMLFTKYTDQDFFDQDVIVAAKWGAGKLALEAQGRFETLSAANIDVGNRIRETVELGFLNANYALSAKTSLDSRLSVEHDSYEGGLSSTDARLASTLNYQVLPKTMLGLGGAYGHTTVENGSDQNYEQGFLHLHFVPTQKLSFEATGGVEVRQISGGPERASPVFEIAATYAVQDSTAFRLLAARRTETSALFASQDIERTTIEASLRQRFLQRAYLTISGGFQDATYVDAGAAADRTDKFAYFGVESSVELTKWLSVRAGYRYQNDDSTASEFSFRRNLTDLQFSLRF